MSYLSARLQQLSTFVLVRRQCHSAALHLSTAVPLNRKLGPESGYKATSTETFLSIANAAAQIVHLPLPLPLALANPSSFEG